jgi:hypothetical protein
MSHSDAHADDAARWMTFAELAASRGTSKRAAVTLVRRHGWRRERNNEGHVIALVPLTWTDGATADATDSEAHGEAHSEAHADAFHTRALAAMEDALVALREAHAGETATLSARLADAAGRADALQDRLTAAEEAIAAERGRADRAEQGREGERERADTLRDLLDAAQAELVASRETEDRARAQAHAAQDEASALRQAEVARRARGLVARLKAAWRRE